MLMPKKVKYRKQQRGRMTRQGLARVGRVVRRLRAEGAGAVLDDRAADRSGARRDDPLHQARRQDLGSRVPGQADHEEAAGNANGQGQGRARGLGVRRPPGPHPVRDGRRAPRPKRVARCSWPRPSCRSRRSSPRGSPRRRRHEGRRTPRADGRRAAHARKELDDQLFRLRIQKSMGQLEAPAKLRGVRRDLARIKTILREKQK